MGSSNTFFPEKALAFTSLPDQFPIIAKMGRIYQRLHRRGIPKREAFYYAYTETHRNSFGVSTAIGSEEFYRQLTEYLRTAMDIVERVIHVHFRPYAERLPAHQTVANCLDPIDMLLLATETPGTHRSRLEYRRHFEARRQLGIALQLFSVESVDHERWVAEDLSQIEQLSWEYLFTQGESTTLWVLATIDPENDHRVKDIALFPKRRSAMQEHRKLVSAGEHVEVQMLVCRVVNVEGKRFLIHVINRRKRLFSTLLKLERGRGTTDRRGWKYVVVGVQERGVRVATREDAECFWTHTQNVLWQHPLVSKPDEDRKNPHRHDDYWDLKVVGHFLRPDNGRVVAGSAEQLVTTLRDHLDTIYTTSGFNHDLYRHQQVLDTIAPLWFPHERGSFGKGMRLPHYGVRWSTQAVREELLEWWTSQL